MKKNFCLTASVNHDNYVIESSSYIYNKHFDIHVAFQLYISTLCKTLTLIEYWIQYQVSSLSKKPTVWKTVLDLTCVRNGKIYSTDIFRQFLHIWSTYWPIYIFQCQQFLDSLMVFAMFQWPRNVPPSYKNSMTQNCYRPFHHLTRLSLNPKKTYVCECTNK